MSAPSVCHNETNSDTQPKSEESTDQNKALALLALAVAAIATVSMAGGRFELWGTMVGLTLWFILRGYAPKAKGSFFQAAAVSAVGGMSFLFIVGVLIDWWGPSLVKSDSYLVSLTNMVYGGAEQLEELSLCSDQKQKLVMGGLHFILWLVFSVCYWVWDRWISVKQ